MYVITPNTYCSLFYKGKWCFYFTHKLLILHYPQSSSRRGSASSEGSLSIEAALECFDFLDAESDEENDESKRSLRYGQTIQGDQDHAGRLADVPLKFEEKPYNSNSLESKAIYNSRLNSLESKSSGKSSQSNTLEDKSARSSEGSKSSDSSTLEDKSRSSGRTSFSNTLEDKSGKSADFSSGTSTLELDHDHTLSRLEFQSVENFIKGSEDLQKCLYIHFKRILKLLQVSTLRS